MRASLAMVFLSSFAILAGNPSLAADNKAVGEASAASAGKPVEAAVPPTSTASEPGSATTPAPGVAPSGANEAASTAAPAANPAEAPSTVAPASAAAGAAALEPHKRPVPDGYAAAAELFKQRKFAQAQKEFEAIVATGAADINTHLCLAHCYLQQKIYSKAIKEFDLLSKHAKNSMSLQKSCAQTATSLRNAMRGVCPANCLKGHDPRWTLKAGSKVILVPHNGGGYDTLTPNDIGHLIVYEHGNCVVKGVCPICEGTTEVPVLKDGGPMPRI
ncbi:MAG: hypothetical protein DKT66_01915 [Candidatus Melainabacteria bacterium]|nr:MAG: hypothetical protein DKT66_01915 [Candidatus Melainabacteria bacterium]